MLLERLRFFFSSLCISWLDCPPLGDESVKKGSIEKRTGAIVIESKLRDINIQLMSKCFLMDGILKPLDDV